MNGCCSEQQYPNQIINMDISPQKRISKTLWAAVLELDVLFLFCLVLYYTEFWEQYIAGRKGKEVFCVNVQNCHFIWFLFLHPIGANIFARFLFCTANKSSPLTISGQILSWKITENDSNFRVAPDLTVCLLSKFLSSTEYMLYERLFTLVTSGKIINVYVLHVFACCFIVAF